MLGVLPYNVARHYVAAGHGERARRGAPPAVGTGRAHHPRGPVVEPGARPAVGRGARGRVADGAVGTAPVRSRASARAERLQARSSPAVPRPQSRLTALPQQRFDGNWRFLARRENLSVRAFSRNERNNSFRAFCRPQKPCRNFFTSIVDFKNRYIVLYNIFLLARIVLISRAKGQVTQCGSSKIPCQVVRPKVLFTVREKGANMLSKILRGAVLATFAVGATVAQADPFGGTASTAQVIN